MSKIKDLIEFLRLDRRHEETEAKSQGVDQTKVTVTTIDTNETRVINRTEFENSNIYLRIVNPLDKYKPTDFYVLPQIDKSIYYIKIDDCVDGFNYLNLENSRCEKVDDEQLLQKIEIGHATNHYFYDKNNREVVFSSENIEEVAVFGDRILFDPEKLDITTGTYSYSYSKPITTFCQFINGIINIIKLLENPFLFLSNGDKKKDVNVYVKQKGSIFLIPTISSIDDYFYATYYYTSSGKKMFYQINNTEDVAIQLEFNGKEPFLSFLNETIFTQQYFDYLDENVNERRIEFISKFKQLIIAPLEKEMNSNSEAAFYDAMVTLYYLTDTIALTLSNETLWKLFETGISRNSLTNKGSLEEENIYLKLLEAIANKETTKIAFLNRLLRKKGNTTTTYLEFLFNSIHGDNGTTFAKLVNKVWKQSRFVIPDSNQNKEFLTTNGPIILPYESEKWLGFYFSNAAVDFDDENQIAVSIKTGHYEEVINTQSRTAVPYMKEIPAHFNYHPFHPIYIKNVEKQETSLKLDAIVPAFMLMANQNQQFWHNVIKTGEYGLDVITTFSGIGNLAKFRYLARLGEASSIIAKVKLGVGLVEVTSGVTNILLKLTGFEDTELGKSIQEYLFWLELLSLSGEITVAIKNGLKKSAKDALTHSDDLKKQLDEVVIEDGKASRKLNEAEKGKFWDEIKEVAEVERKLGDFIMHGGDDISETFIKNVVKQIRESTGLKNFDIHLVDRNNEKYKKLFDQWQKGGGHGFFKPTSGEFGIPLYKGLFGEGPQIYMFAGRVVDNLGRVRNVSFTKYTTQHELFHVEMFMYLKNKTPNYMKYWNEIPTYMHEQYVLNRLIKTKNWKQADLMEDLKIINGERKKFNPKLNDLTLKELESWKFEIELEKMGIKIK